MISISMWFRLSKMGSRLMFIIGLGHRISGHIERRQELRKSRLFSRPIPLYCDGGAAGACSHSRRCNERNHILSEARLEWIAKSKGENIRFFYFYFCCAYSKILNAQMDMIDDNVWMTMNRKQQWWIVYIHCRDICLLLLSCLLCLLTIPITYSRILQFYIVESKNCCINKQKKRQ